MLTSNVLSGVCNGVAASQTISSLANFCTRRIFSNVALTGSRTLEVSFCSMYVQITTNPSDFGPVLCLLEFETFVNGRSFAWNENAAWF